jgi:hypothetical protein
LPTEEVVEKTARPERGRALMVDIPPLLIQFALHLETSDTMERGFAPSGMAFHRWLPDGRQDTIELATGHAGSTLEVWFKRWGWVEEGDDKLPQVHYAINREDVTDFALGLQGRLSSGPLLGLFRTDFLGADELTAMTEGASGTEPYIDLGRRVVAMLVPPLQRLIGAVQTDYGQYWLRDLEEWDSRRGSLGNYCRMFQMRWSVDDGLRWGDFTPTDSVVQVSGALPRLAVYRSHLSKDDWVSLADAAASFPKGSVALELIGRAREMEDFRGDLRLAIVETATAAEVAVDEYLTSRPEDEAYAKTIIPEFRNLSAQAQFSFIASALVRVPKEVMFEAAPAWKFRHKVVHEGWRPNSHDEQRVASALSNLQRATAQVLGRGYRRVSAFNWGAVALPERWDADTLALQSGETPTADS